MTDRDDAPSHDEWARLVWETEPLVRLLADRYEARLDPDDPATARYFDWLVRDARARQKPHELLSDAQLQEMCARVRALIQTERLGVRFVREELRVVSREEAAERWPGRRTFEVHDASVAAGSGRELWDEPCDTLSVLPDDLPRGHYVGLRVAGDSMSPAIEDGDIVLIRVGDRIRRGSPVVARHPDDGYLLKVVGRVAPDHIELCSLNPRYPVVRLPRDGGHVLGSVVCLWRNRAGRRRGRR